MILANELMIGNIVDTEYGILSIHASMLVDIVNNGFVVNPIPLTPEILESCGFAKADNDHLSDFIKETLHVNFIISHNGYEYESFCIGLTHKKILGNDRDFMNFGIELRFLHQLQNLYFALEGTELEINLHVETHQ